MATINKVNLVDLSVHVGIVEMSPLYYQYGVDNPEINVFDGHDFHNSSFRCLYGIPSITSDIFRCIDCVMTSVVSEIKRILINSFKLENEKITEVGRLCHLNNSCASSDVLMIFVCTQSYFLYVVYRYSPLGSMVS